MRPQTFLICGVLLSPMVSAAPPLFRVDYEGFTVWLDCKEHGMARFRYNAQRDSGEFPRESSYRLDPQVPYECQPSSANTFKTDDPRALTYERGHQVPVNHLDHSELAVKQSNYMTNVLPQTYQLNRGAWLRTEEIVECYRDSTELLVLGGAVWGNRKRDKANDWFVGSHNLRTPDWFWKVVIRGDGQTIAWWIPNDEKATRLNLDTYLIKPAQLQVKAKVKLPEVPKKWRWRKPDQSWALPQGCDLG